MFASFSVLKNQFMNLGSPRHFIKRNKKFLCTDTVKILFSVSLCLLWGIIHNSIIEINNRLQCWDMRMCTWLWICFPLIIKCCDLSRLVFLIIQYMILSGRLIVNIPCGLIENINEFHKTNIWFISTAWFTQSVFLIGKQLYSSNISR